MPVFPESVIQEVTEKNDIYDVVSKYVRLKKAGSSYVGLCPFHNEKTPSFSVSVHRGVFKCFGCGEGGDSISFVMKIENISFVEAVTKLAENANITLPKVSGASQKDNEKLKKDKETVYDVNMEAAKFFYSNLKTSKPAVDYLIKRELTGQDAKNFWLGYAPDSWNALYDYLREKGFTETDIYNAGLIKKHDSGRYYDFFRNRLMIPIFDTSNRVIGFGGRVLDDSKPKYLNSPETIVFSKSRNLYGLNNAKNAKKDTVLLCEGYMDVIAVQKSGYLNAVATLGTALTSGQASMLSKMFGEIIICYDSDSAGCTARNKAIGILRDYDIKISLINMGDKKDPDEYIKAYGKVRFENLIKNRKTDMVYIMDYFKEDLNIKNPQDKITYISKVVEYLKLIKNSVEQDVYVNMLARSTEVNPNAIYAQLGILKSKNVKDTVEDPVILQLKNVRKNDNAVLSNTYEMMLSLIIFNKQVYNKHKDEIILLFKDNKSLLPVLEYVAQLYASDGEVNPNKLLAHFSGEDAHSYVAGIISLDNKCDNPERAFTDYVKVINNLKRKIKITECIKDGGDLNTINSLLKQ